MRHQDLAAEEAAVVHKRPHAADLDVARAIKRVMWQGQLNEYGGDSRKVVFDI